MYQGILIFIIGYWLGWKVGLYGGERRINEQQEIKRKHISESMYN